MARSAGTYSRFVATLKIALPLIALVLLGTVFLVTSPDEFRGAGLNFTEADKRALGQGLNVLDPTVSGVTSGGDTYVFRARKMSSATAEATEISAEGLSGTITQTMGRAIDLAGQTAVFDVGAETFTLSGGATLDTSDGYSVRTDGLQGDLANGRIQSLGPVSADGPAGHVEAGGVILRFSQGDPVENAVIRFDNGVRLTFVPQPD
jgi:lipopolysaccharide export system protein LptC